MNKEDLLREITTASKEKQVTRTEVLIAYDAGAETQMKSPQDVEAFGMEDIMRYLGGGIVAIGIGIFLATNWDALNVFARILSTLGSGVLAYNIGAMLSKQDGRSTLAQAFHLIAIVVLPIGIFVTLDEMYVDVSATSITSLVFLALTAFYLLSYRMFTKNLFMLASIVFGTAAFFNLTAWLTEGTAIFSEEHFTSYQFLIVGLTYILLGHDFARKSMAPLTRYLYSFGLVFFFGATFSLGGYFPDQNMFWELMFPGLALGAVFLSLSLRSRAFLIIGSIALVAYIFKITDEYFADSFGWPFALILAGFGMIAVGSLFVRLNKRYRSLE